MFLAFFTASCVQEVKNSDVFPHHQAVANLVDGSDFSVLRYYKTHTTWIRCAESHHRAMPHSEMIHSTDACFPPCRIRGNLQFRGIRRRSNLNAKSLNPES